MLDDPFPVTNRVKASGGEEILKNLDGEFEFIHNLLQQEAQRKDQVLEEITKNLERVEEDSLQRFNEVNQLRETFEQQIEEEFSKGPEKYEFYILC